MTMSDLTVLYAPAESTEYQDYEETYTFIDPKGREVFELFNRCGHWQIDHTHSVRYTKALLRKIFPDVKMATSVRGHIYEVFLTTLHHAMLRLVRRDRYED